MSYNLTGAFAPDFFLAEGEPYDRSDLALNSQGKPISLYSACTVFARRHRRRALDLLEIPSKGRPNVPEDVLTQALYDRALEVNICGDLRVPVDVWLDYEGDEKVDVWDDRPRGRKRKR